MNRDKRSFWHFIRHYVGLVLLFILEAVLLAGVLYISLLLRNQIVGLLHLDKSYIQVNSQLFMRYVWILGIFSVFLLKEKLWTGLRTFWDEWEAIVKAAFQAVIVSYAYVALTQSQDITSRIVIFVFYALSVLVLPVWRYFLKTRRFLRRFLERRVLYVGSQKYRRVLGEILNINKFLNMSIIGGISYQDLALNPKAYDWRKVVKDIVQAAEKIYNICKDKHINTVILEAEFWGIPVIDALAEFLTAKGLNVFVFPKHIAYPPDKARTYHLMYENYFLIEIPKGLNSRFARVIKRIFDLVVGGILFVLLLPFLILTGLLTFIGDGFPIFYVVDRFGQFGKKFKFFKFRYMRKDTSADRKKEVEFLEEFFKKYPKYKKHWEEYKKLPVSVDPRIIPRTGKIIAALNLSELAQIINVLKGDMSLVGPRPYLTWEKKDIGPYFDRIHIAKPGITGLWTALGGNARTFQERLEIDSWYSRNWSFWLDIKILLKTGIILWRKVMELIFKKHKNDT